MTLQRRHSKDGTGGVVPCSGRMKAGSEMWILSKKSSGQADALQGSRIHLSPSRRTDKAFAFRCISLGSLIVCPVGVSMTSAVISVIFIVLLRLTWTELYRGLEWIAIR